ncbi:MAG TPA: DNA cytosine methyltransferase [Chitinophagales bacterium]|nr:DNA cytosine methyltransferase [Chitinophagales bacterium]
MNDQITYIDLFAGAGGLSEGFIREGYLPIAHVEKDTNACLTLTTRLAYHHLVAQNQLNIYHSYLKKEISRDELYSYLPKELKSTIINQEISDATLSSIFTIIDNNLKNYGRNKVDVVIGGPPCQAYSVVGRARIRDEKKKNEDPRRFLFKLYVRFLQEYQPKIFIFENVPGILNAKDEDSCLFIHHIEAEFRNAGYTMKYQILNASNYGVLQNRNRVFIVGWQTSLNIDYPAFEHISFPNPQVWNDLLSDLPALKAGQNWASHTYLTLPTQYQQKFGIRDKTDLLTWHIARPNNDNDLAIYKLAIEKWFNEDKRLLYTDVPTTLRKQKNQNSFLNRFSVVEGNKAAAHTMVAHIAQDGHYYIHPDINQLRSITVREAARIQSFPDNYFFEGTRTYAFTQIGNAVPPLVGQAIAKKLLELL